MKGVKDKTSGLVKICLCQHYCFKVWAYQYLRISIVCYRKLNPQLPKTCMEILGRKLARRSIKSHVLQGVLSILELGLGQGNIFWIQDLCF